MDSKIINNIMCNEISALSKLLELLEEQHDLLIANDLLGLEGIVDRIKAANKEIAEYEVERRRNVQGESMSSVIAEFKDDELDTNFRHVQKVLHEIEVQKEMKDMLIKLGLGYSSKMLNIINPGGSAKTYNSYGNLKK